MKIVTGATGELHVTSSDDGAHWAALWGDKEIVLKSNNMFELEIETSNDIKVLSGDLIMQGRHGRIPYGEYDALEIANGTTGYLRNDIIACEYDESAGVETMELVVVQGTPVREGEEPADPDLTKGDIMANEATNQMALWRVRLDGVNIAETEQMFEFAENVTADNDGNVTIDGTVTAGGDIEAGGDLNLTDGDIYIPNARRLYTYDPNGGLRTLAWLDSSDAYHFATGSRSNTIQIGTTNYTTRLDLPRDVYAETGTSGTRGVHVTRTVTTDEGEEEEHAVSLLHGAQTSSGNWNRGIYADDQSTWMMYYNGTDFCMPLGYYQILKGNHCLIHPSTAYTDDNRILQVQNSNSDSYVDRDLAYVPLTCGYRVTTNYSGAYMSSGSTYHRTADSSTGNVRCQDGTAIFALTSSSSSRYKNSINYLNNQDYATVDTAQMPQTIDDKRKKEWTNDIHSILNIPIAKFHFNDGYITDPEDYDNSQWVTGFIAEDVDEICPECCSYHKDEESGEEMPEAWEANQFIPRMLYIIQEQEKRIAELEEKIEALSK